MAMLANLPLTKKQVEAIGPHLRSVLAYTKQVQSLKTKGVEETSQVTGLTNVFREDEVERNHMFSQGEALANAPHSHNGYFLVPPVLEEQ